MNKKVLFTLIDQIALEQPEKTAIIKAENGLTYHQLFQQSNQIAQCLINTKVERNAPIATYLPSSPAYIASILGINKAGAAFMPLELNYPRLRLKYLLEVVAPKCIITTKPQLEDLQGVLDFVDYQTNLTILVLDFPTIEVWNLTAGKLEQKTKEVFSTEAPNLGVDGNDSAYFIYTSGSTGKYPKIIEGMHKSMSHFIHWEKKEFAVNEQVRVSQLAPLSFDVSLRDIFLPLLAGGTLCIPTKEDRALPNDFLRWLAAKEINLIHTVPSFFRVLINQMKEVEALRTCVEGVKTILLAGEPLLGKDVANWRTFGSADTQLVNLYGPSETTLAKIFNRIEPSKEYEKNEIIPLGKPISNTNIAILRGNNLCGIGAIGEICIKTPFRSKGYYKNEALNKEKFIQNPLHNEYEDIIYRTGDLGKLLPDENIAFVGRQDSQVKIRGNRVELGEVEKSILGCPGIEQTLVLPFLKQDDDLILIAYYTSTQVVTNEEINKRLADLLPSYMQPSFYVALESFPLNLNGKIDKKALPQPEELLYEKFKYVAPETALEKSLAEIWSEMLGLKKIGVENTLFELGGHSLTATRIVAKICHQLELQLSLKELFQMSTIRGLATLLEQKNKAKFQTIPQAPEAKDYPLSHAQKRLWVISRFEGTATAYNLPFIFLFEGEFDTDVFCKAWKILVERHEILRTTFIEVNNQPRQIIHPIDTLDYLPQLVDFSKEYQKEDLSQNVIDETSEHAFDLAKGPLFRSNLIQLEDQKFLFVLNMHHIITDDWSVDVLQKELEIIYRDVRSGDEIKLPVPNIQYKDFAYWQQQNFEKKGYLEKAEGFWRQQLTEIPVFEFPLDFPRPPIKSYAGAIHRFKLDATTTQALTAFCEQNNATLFFGLLASIRALLYRYTGQQDLILGTPVNGREHLDLQDQIGFYVNLLPLRVQVDPKMPFRKLLASVSDTALAAFEYQQYPFDLLVEKLDVKRDTSRAPLFDVGFTWHDTIPETEEESSIFQATHLPSSFATSKTDLWFHANREEEEIEFHIEYCTDLFLRERMEQIAEHLQYLLTSFLENPDLQLAEVTFLDQEEQLKLKQFSKGETVALPQAKTIPALLKSQLTQFAERPAIYYKGQELNYTALDQKAEKLAQHLRTELGVQAGDRVAVLLERSPDLIIALLAILKAGAVYLPIDLTLPVDRKAFILEDAKANCLITHSEQLFNLEYYNGQLFAIDIQMEDLPNTSTIDLETGKGDDPAYMIYTSGSTGNPKGVVVPHQGLINMSLDQIRQMGIRSEDGVLQFASISFDASVYEIFMAMFAGAKLVIVSPETILDGDAFINYLKTSEVSVATLPPSFLNTIRPQRLNFLRVIITAGESPILEDAFECIAFSDYYNAFGPTECSVCISSYQVTEADRSRTQLPIGRPISNMEILILDDNLNQLPIGVSGEICVTGVGLAKGYFKQASLTAEHFVKHPFDDNQILYKTGDIGRWLFDGNLLFEERRDNQIKLNGHRIELEEIARCLERHEEVQTAVCLLKKANNSANLVLCYTAVNGALDTMMLEQHLAAFLPAYMLPTFICHLEKFPLTTSAKVDKKALLASLSLENTTTDNFQTPRTPSEYQLVQVCQELFNKEHISVKDNFFELGGNSLKAMQLVALVQKKALVKLSLTEVFAQPVLEQLAVKIDGLQKLNYEPIAKVEEMEHYPLSHAQRRLWVISKFDGAASAYNIPMTFRIDGAIDRILLAESWAELVQRHESLRTNFIEIDHDTRQVIHTKEVEDINFLYKDLRQTADHLNLAKAFVEEQAEIVFDLATDPLYQVSLLHLEDELHWLVLTIHHIISDDWSLDVLHKELQFIYKAKKEGKPYPLAPLAIQYKDYANWQLSQNTVLTKEHEFWHNQFKDGVPVVNFPTEFPRPPIKTYEGKSYNFMIPADLTQRLQQLDNDGLPTLFPLIFTAIKVLVYRYTGQTDLVMGTPIAGRTHPDLLDQTGFYINSLSIRTTFEHDWSFWQLFEQVQHQINAAIDHQNYPFDLLVEELNVKRDISRAPIFDFGFTWHDMAISEKEETSLLQFEEELNDIASAKADLWFHGGLETEGVSLSIEYASDLFSEQRVKSFADQILRILNSVAKEKEQTISQINLLSESEAAFLLTDLKGLEKERKEAQSITDLFEQQVEKNPDEIALVFKDQRLTYRAINKQANRLAHHLLKKEALQIGDKIGVNLQRSPEYVISILGVMKAGGVFVPIETDLPLERKAYIMKDAGLKLLITQSDYLFDFDFFDGALFAADIQLEALETASSNPILENYLPHLAYLIYTSGSTGQPKGVLIKHQGIINMSLGQINTFGILPEDRVVQFASISFDASISEIFMALFVGARLVFVETETIKDQVAFAQFLETEKITVATIPPSYLNVLDLDKLKGLRVLVSAGESPNTNKLRSCAQFCNVFNAYGPSEYSVCVSIHKVDPEKTDQNVIPIGKPINNTEVFILDEHQQLLPFGASGMIAVSGLGLAEGYWNQAELTEAKFIDHPFQKEVKLYLTGDYGQWLADGSLFFEGRRDQQVKWRGYRIELEEISGQLQRIDQVNSAVTVMAGEKDAHQILATFYTLDTPIDASEIKTKLQKILPSYMIPSQLIELEEFPINNSGKVDRKQLLERLDDHFENKETYVAPQSDTEKQLVSIFEQQFDRSPIGIEDDFFSLGGQSLTAIQILSTIQEEFGKKLKLDKLFIHPVIADLTRLIDATELSDQVSIPATPEQADYPLSQAQKRLWFISQFEQSKKAFNLPAVYLLEGDLNIDAFGKALDWLIERHEILRTTFEEVGGEPRQKIHPAATNNLQVLDFRTDDAVESKSQMAIEAAIDTSFDLGKQNLFLFQLIRQTEERTTLVINMHHIIADGWSIDLIYNELSQAYEQFKSGQNPDLAPLSIQYKDYAVWQLQQFAQKGHLNASRDYWVNQFKEEVDVLELPTDFSRPAVKSYNGDRVEIRLESELAQQLNELCIQQGATLFSGVLTTVKCLLQIFSSQKDLVVGIDVAGRELLGLQEQVGFYINRLGIRTQLNFEQKLTTLLAEVNQQLLEAFEHQAYPFDLLVEELQTKRDMSRSPLFDVGMTWNTSEMNRVQESTALDIEELDFDYAPAKVDLWFHFYYDGSAINLSLVYNTDLFKKETIQRMLTQFQHLLSTLVSKPDTALTAINYLKESDKKQLLKSFNESDQAKENTTDVLSLFKDQVQKNSNQVALQFYDHTWTYAELDHKANQLANHLVQELNLSKNDRIALVLDRSPEMIIAILAILKVGAAFVPIDPKLPLSRKSYVLQDAAPKMLLTQSDYLFDLQFYEGPLFAVDIQLENLDTSTEHPTVDIDSTNLAYVIYTSGSTGQPKGVGVNRGNLANYINWANSYYFTEGEEYVFGLFTLMSFDLSITALFTSLTGGRRLQLFGEKEPEQLLIESLASDHKVNVLKLTPSHIDLLMTLWDERFNATVKVLILGGESLKEHQINFLLTHFKGIAIYNEYGPTEATVGCIVKKVENALDYKLIGQPISHNQIYILNETQQLLPIGAWGEIAIAGRSLATGYLNLPALTSQKFVANPYAEKTENNRMYLTGDIARWLPNGSIEFKGRSDRQVKLMGYRIELDEIESSLNALPEIAKAAVTTKTTGQNDVFIAAYYVPAQEGFSKDQLKVALREKLPNYMVPTAFFELSDLPLTRNGKLNYKELVKIADLSNTVEFEAAQTPLEKQLVVIWQDVLASEPIGLNQNFFELGGHSLKATMLVARVKQEITSKIEVIDLFNQPKLKDFVAVVEQNLEAKETMESIPKVAEQAHYPVSNAQRRLWVLNQFELSKTAYNVVESYELEGAIDQNALDKAIELLIARHEVLRSAFLNVEGQPRQYVQAVDPALPSLEYTDLSQSTDPKHQLDQLLERKNKHQFDLATGPLYHFCLIKTNEDRYTFLLMVHHIICDGWSLEILINEITSNYAKLIANQTIELSQLPIQYKDFAHWQNQKITSGAFDVHKDYWVNLCSGTLPILDLPTDYPRPRLRTFNGAIASTVIDSTTKTQLEEFAVNQECSLFMLMVAAVNTLLYKYTHQKDLIIGSPSAGRIHQELEEQIGFYINNLIVRTQIEEEASFETLLAQVKQSLLAAYQHQEYPFDLLVEKLDLKKDLSRSPIFDVVVVMQNFNHLSIGSDTDDAIEMTPKDSGYRTNTVDLRLVFLLREDELELKIDYNTDLFKPARIEQMLAHFQTLLKTILQKSDQAVATLNCLSTEETSQLLNQFNPAATPFSDQQTLVQLFETQVEKNPKKVAIEFTDSHLTLEELNQRANQLAHHLRDEMGVKRGELVAVSCDRSLEMIVAILAILKAGAAYLPVDPAYPEARKQYIFQDTQVQTALIHSDFLSDLPFFDGQLFALDIQLSILETSTENPVLINQAEDLAYVIYTSGSTGYPKGVMIAHRSCVNMVESQIERFGIRAEDKVLQFASIGFDASVSEIFKTLLAGATLVLVKKATINSLDTFQEYITEKAVTVMTLPPLFLKLLDPERLSTIRVLITAGSAAHLEEAQTYQKQAQYFNAYGPTEYSVCISIFPAKDLTPNAQRIPIGYPIANTKVYLLDEHLQLVPLGIEGDLYVSGAGLALGYWNKPELTARSFVTNPFEAGTLMYKTGDRAIWNAEGALVFAGRKDKQVKVRGYRIELEEIENVVKRLAGIKGCYTTLKTVEEQQKLITYYQTESEHSLDGNAMRQHLQSWLPEYMLPDFFIEVDEFALNFSGKIDEDALPIPLEIAQQASTFVAPNTEIENLLVDVWQNVLAISDIGITHRFFDLGGDSIKAIQIAARMYAKGYVLEVNDIFQHNTIEEIASNIKKRVHEIDQGVVTGPVPLTPIQRWFFESELKTPHYYNQAVIVDISTDLQLKDLRPIFDKLMEHHDALRMVFKREQGKIVQLNEGLDLQADLSDFDLHGSTDVQAVLQDHIAVLQQNFNLEQGPLFKAALFRWENESRLFLQVHHLLVDGVSWRILFEDIALLLEQTKQQTTLELPLKTTSFKEWAIGLQDFADSTKCLKELNYWKDVCLKSYDTIPSDLENSAVCLTKDCKVVSFVLDQPNTESLLFKANQAFNTQINDLLLTALASTLNQQFQLSKTLISLEGHGREDILEEKNIGRTVGWFTSDYPVALNMLFAEDRERLIIEIKEAMRQIPNKGIGYGLLRYLSEDIAQKDRNALEVHPKISFNYLGQFNEQLGEKGEQEIAEESAGDMYSKEEVMAFDFQFSAMIFDGQFRLDLNYNALHFSEALANAFGQTFIEELKETIHLCERKEVSEITPSDVSQVPMSLEDFDNIFE